MSPLNKKRIGKYLRPMFLMVDWALFNIFIAFTLRIFPIVAAEISVPWMWVLVNVSFLPVIVMESRRSNNPFRAIRLERVVGHTLCMVGLHALFFLSFTSLFGLLAPPTKFYLTYYAFMCASAVLWAILSRKIVKHYRTRGLNYVRVVIVGTNATSRRLFDEMKRDPGYGYRVLGFFDIEARDNFEGKYCGALDQLDNFVKDNAVDQIYFTMPGHDKILTEVVKIADDNVVEFFYVPQISQYISRGFQLANIGAVPVLTIRRNPLKRMLNRALKRAFDLIVSGTFLIFYPLIYIPIAIGIKLSSPGPIYFVQQRTGYKGQPFGCLKFRSMRVNANADTQQATDHDPRKTKFGDFLRRSSLDELPQFINVFKGDMSIVGPRPHMLSHTEEYSQLVDKYMVRHLVKPGITGWAQVNGYRGLTDELWKMERRVQYDVWYIENWTFLLDLRIVVRTALNTILHKDENAF